MRVALLNPPWSFDGSIYFGCREPHLPLELGYTRALLEERGHAVRLIDAQLAQMDLPALVNEVAAFKPDVTVVTTAPSYLFWRCAPPELRVPIQTLRAIAPHAGRTIAVGPHASTTAGAVLRKLGVGAAVLGECEEVVPRLVEADPADYGAIPCVAHLARDTGGEARLVANGPNAAADMARLPALRWSKDDLARHRHHHHRFERAASGPGAEMEVSRGCPYSCTFCAKENFRNRYRKRPLPVVLDELDGLIAAGARYVYFIDEIFLPDRELCEALVQRDIEFGVQLRIDNWSTDMLTLLGKAGCVSIEAGVESITADGRRMLNKRCKMSTEELTELLIHAKQHVPFVQANLIGTSDSAADVATWRARLAQHGVWSNEPVPLFPYPGSPEYRLRWGGLDDQAWERAHEQYLRDTRGYSDIQEQRPLPLSVLER
jgi:anaerobic magnesium-protoporphyrin IX monomethyl ester cyclase